MIKRNPLPNEHAARQKSPELFKTFRRSKNFRNKPLPAGISVIYGIRKEKGPRGGSTEIQSFRFDKNKWGVREAKKWLKDNGFETKIEKATKRKKNPLNEITLQQKQIMIDQLKILGDLLYQRSSNPDFLNWLNQERLPEIIILLKYDILEPSFKDSEFGELFLTRKPATKSRYKLQVGREFMSDIHLYVDQIYKLKNDRIFLDDLDYKKLKRVTDLIDDINYEWKWS